MYLILFHRERHGPLFQSKCQNFFRGWQGGGRWNKISNASFYLRSLAACAWPLSIFICLFQDSKSITRQYRAGRFFSRNPRTTCVDNRILPNRSSVSKLSNLNRVAIVLIEARYQKQNEAPKGPRTGGGAKLDGRNRVVVGTYDKFSLVNWLFHFRRGGPRVPIILVN